MLYWCVPRIGVLTRIRQYTYSNARSHGGGVLRIEYAYATIVSPGVFRELAVLTWIVVSRWVRSYLGSFSFLGLHCACISNLTAVSHID